MDNFSIMVLGLLYIFNAANLEKLAEEIFTTALVINLYLGIPKTEHMYCIFLSRETLTTLHR